MPEAQRRAYRRIVCVSSGALAALAIAYLNCGLDPKDIEAFLATVGPHGRRAIARPWHLSDAFDMTLRFFEDIAARQGPVWCDACVASLDLRIYAIDTRRRCHRPQTWQDFLAALRATSSIPGLNRSCAKSLDGISVFEEDFVDDLRGCTYDVLGYPPMYTALCYACNLSSTPPLELAPNGRLPSYSRASYRTAAAALLCMLLYLLRRRGAATRVVLAKVSPLAWAFGRSRHKRR
jgi:hypothetical protein